MRIVIEQSNYAMTNLGDVAMAQVAVSRLLRLWPGAHVGIVTDRPDRLAMFYPGISAVSAAGRWRWLQEDPIFGGNLVRSIPDWISVPAGRLEARMRRKSPRLIYSGVWLWERLQRPEARMVGAFFAHMRKADLLVVSGAGHITSTFETHALKVLELLRLGRSLGARTVMFGQGLGPIHTPRLWEAVRAILPHVDLICLREKRKGLPILEEVGVSRDRVMITGDDAVELAHAERRADFGRGIGVNIRRAFYSGIDDRAVRSIRPVLHEAGARHSAQLVVLPVSVQGTTLDLLTISDLVDGYPGNIDGPADIETPLQLIRQIAQCRVVVTGSYHAAVFALAQGIPAIGLAASEYFVDKFLGLSDMFGGGCELVRLDDPGFPEHLRAAIDRAWSTAGDIRPMLLAAAARQVAASKAAYVRCHELVRAGKRAGRGFRRGRALSHGPAQDRPSSDRR